MIRFRVGHSWRRETPGPGGPRDAFAFELEGINVLPGANDEPLVRIVGDLVDAVAALVVDGERAGQVSLEEVHLELCLWRTRGNEVTVWVIDLSQPPRQVRAPIAVELPALVEAAVKCARGFLRDVGQHKSDLEPELVSLEKRLKRLTGAVIEERAPRETPSPWTAHRLLDGEHADRRGQYLDAATDLLVSDLEEMVADWQEGGPARTALAESGLPTIFTGMGSLSFGELAGERMKLGLLLHDPEEEHDCFSDNTYISHLNDAIGIQNVYLGKYVRVDGSVVEGPSISEIVADKDASLDAEIKALLADTVAKMEIMKTRGDTIEKYDQMIAEGNEAGNAVVQAAIDALIAQTRGVERAVALLQLDGAVTIEQSDSLTNPDAVFQ